MLCLSSLATGLLRINWENVRENDAMTPLEEGKKEKTGKEGRKEIRNNAAVLASVLNFGFASDVFSFFHDFRADGFRIYRTELNVPRTYHGSNGVAYVKVSYLPLAQLIKRSGIAALELLLSEASVSVMQITHLEVIRAN